MDGVVNCEIGYVLWGSGGGGARGGGEGVVMKTRTVVRVCASGVGYKGLESLNAAVMQRIRALILLRLYSRRYC